MLLVKRKLCFELTEIAEVLTHLDQHATTTEVRIFYSYSSETAGLVNTDKLFMDA